MTPEQFTALMTRIAATEHRQIDQFTLEAWEPLIIDLDYTDALEATLEHYRTPGQRWIAAGDIRHGVIRARNARAARREQIEFADVCVNGRAHHWNDDSGWCNNGCGYRSDGQSEYSYRGATHNIHAPKLKHAEAR